MESEIIINKVRMLLYEDITDQIIAAYYEVYNTLGYGFLEQVYQNAMYKELCHRNMLCSCQKRIDVIYKSELVGYYIPDIIVEDKIILELKALSEITGNEKAQVINYLKATGIKVGFLMNFGAPEAYFKRLDNHLD